MQHEARLGRERPGDAEPPLVTVRERGGRRVRVRGEAEQLEQPVGPLRGAPPGRRRHRAPRPRRSRAPTARRRRGCAGTCARARAGRAGAAGQRVTSLSLELDRAGRRAVEAAEHVHERRLAGAVRADQADDLAAAQLERHAAERLDARRTSGRWRRPGVMLRASSPSSGSTAAVNPRSSGRPSRRRWRRDVAMLFWILITRYCRPNTVCSVGEKLTRPDSVGTFLNFTICAASAAPFVEPPARLIAVTTPSIAAEPRTKPPVPALTCFASLLTAAVGIVAEDRRERDEVVVRHRRALRQPVRPVAGPRVEDRRVVARAERSPETSVDSAPNAPAVDVTITSAFGSRPGG